MCTSDRNVVHLSTEERLLHALHARGPQTVEELALFLADTSWSQVFLAVDRLSRAGTISLQPVRPCEYRVSLNRSAA